MRELLFRGKRVDNGEWVQGYYVKGATRHCIVNSLACYPRYDVIPETIGQFTGLRDKNGTRIFEGDVVFASTDHADSSRCGRFYNIWVEWVDSSCGFAPFADYNDDECVYCDAEESLVIGNIHDNPALLEGGAE